MKYFQEERLPKMSLKEYFEKVEKKYEEMSEGKKQEFRLTYARARHIYNALGDIEIREDMIQTFGEMYDPSKCRYGSTCVQPATTQTIYGISEMFPELTKEALVLISRLYIKDMFEDYSLIEKLAIAIRREGAKDETFEKFMDEVTKIADKEDAKYNEVASKIPVYFDEYPYDFIKHFQKVVKDHHVSWDKFCKSIPSAELVCKDYIFLKQYISQFREFSSIPSPMSKRMFEDYLAGDTTLSQYDEQPMYTVSRIEVGFSQSTPVPFTRTEMLESIEKKQSLTR